MFYKMFTEYIFLFYHFQCRRRNVVQGILDEIKRSFFQKKKRKRKKLERMKTVECFGKSQLTEKSKVKLVISSNLKSAEMAP